MAKTRPSDSLLQKIILWCIMTLKGVIILYLVYLFREKKSGNVIYVGSTGRPATRMKEHLEALKGQRTRSAIHDYMIENNEELFKEVEIDWIDIAENKHEMVDLEEKYYFRYQKEGHLKNERPGEDRGGHFNPRRRRIVCLNDNKSFKSIVEASKYYGIPRTSISNVAHGYRSYVTKNGTRYKFKLEWQRIV